MRICTFLFCCLASMSAFGQNSVSEEISALKASGMNIHETALCTFVTDDLSGRVSEIEGVTKGSLLSLDPDAIESLFTEENNLIRLTLPAGDREQIQLDLVQHQIFSEDFVLFASDAPGVPVNYTHGLHYRGIVSGDPNSIVALSVFNHELMGLISTGEGNLVLGRIDADRENTHILYNDRDLKKSFAFECATPDDGLGYAIEELQSSPASRDVDDCVRVYIEIDDDIVTQKGGATPATNYITGLFNQSIVLYNAESINMMINEIYAWTTPSPYNGSSSGAMLNAFQDYTDEFNGNIGHLVSYKASGGIAVLDNLCSSNPDWRKCFSSIDATYQNVPTYSWSVMVISHEMGHVVGSKHTHACAWNGDNTAIDGCAGGTEGNCPVPGIPPEGGTIMSYCHLTNVGINFNLGFGPQPGNVLRNRVNATNNCLTSCGPPPPPPPPSYCASNGNNTNYEYIQKVVLGTIDHTSGNNGGYGDFTAMSTDVSPGTSYTIQLTPGFTSSSYTEYWRVWIDYNGDLDWSDAGEMVAQGLSASTLNLSFTVPANASSGTTRMRVSMKYGGYPATCGSFTYGEVEDYGIAISGGGPSCNDGIQNQGEEGVDCGGPCPACPTCDDGIQNQGEEGVDCGGPCAPCETCSDGIQNQGEEGVDCGGPCPACPTCDDGIQNQGEEGIDCGGPCPACPPPPPSEDVELVASYFETGWDGWNDGGGDAARVFSSHSWEGNYSIRIRDNSGKSSSMTSPWLDLTGATSVKMEFYFKSVGMENGEDFIILYKDQNSGWSTIGQVVKGVDFDNDVFYVGTIYVPSFDPNADGKLRIQCDASDNSDNIYVDAVTISKTTGDPLVESMFEVREVAVMPEASEALAKEDASVEDIVVYPNPAQEVLNINYAGTIQALRLMAMDGSEYSVDVRASEEKQMDIQHLIPGMYILMIQIHDDWYPIKFSKL